jgi:UDP-N-acetylmuramate--alanine ligase
MGRPDTVVFSSAVPPDNPEYAAAEAQGALIWHRSAALGALMLGRRGIAVAGSHGKTTTSGMIVTALAGAGFGPGFVIGSPLAASGRSSGLGSGEWFVVEADESDASFFQYPAELAVITTVDLEGEHLDNWQTAEAYVAGFGRFARGEAVRATVAAADDPGAAALAAALQAEGRRVFTSGEDAAAGVRLEGLKLDGPTPSATLTGGGGPQHLTLQVPGRHNLHNAALAYAAGLVAGAPGEALAQALSGFEGTDRRFMKVGEVRGIRVYDAYAPHPREAEATLAAARTLGPKRIVAAFQPHLFSRTRDFADRFGEALAAADVVVVTDVYPAREEPIPGVTGELVADAVADHGGTVTYVPDLAGVAPALAALAQPGDLVLTLGAGSITAAAPEVVRLLEAA